MNVDLECGAFVPIPPTKGSVEQGPSSSTNANSSKPSDRLPNRRRLPGLFRGRDSFEYIICLGKGDTRFIHGAFRFQVLVGSVKVEGFSSTDESFNCDRWHSACVPFSGGYPSQISVDTHEEEQTKVQQSKKKIKSRLVDVTEEFRAASEYLGMLDWPTVVIISMWPSSQARIAHCLYPNWLSAHDHPNAIGKSMYIPPEDFTESTHSLLSAQPFHPRYDPRCIERIETALKNVLARASAARGVQRVMVAGNANTGKSTLARMVVNFFLSNSCPVFYMDCDVGQTEFTPPGVIGCTRVIQPLLDQPFMHQSAHFENAYFFGDCTIEEETLAPYQRLVSAVYDKFEKEEKKGVLIVNTMGWITGLGERALAHIVDTVDPHFVFHCVGMNRMDWSQLPHSRAEEVKVEWNKEFEKNCGDTLRSKDLRELAVMGYFTQGASNSRASFSLLATTDPYAISFEDVRLMLPCSMAFCPDNAIFGAINRQLFALCSFSPNHGLTERRMCNSSKLPLLMLNAKGDDKYLRVHGFGVVRAIDLDTRQLFLFTPMKCEHLEKVDVLVMVTEYPIPDLLITQQKIVKMPYEVYSEKNKHDAFTLNLYKQHTNATSYLRSRNKLMKQYL